MPFFAVDSAVEPQNDTFERASMGIFRYGLLAQKLWVKFSTSSGGLNSSARITDSPAVVSLQIGSMSRFSVKLAVSVKAKPANARGLIFRPDNCAAIAIYKKKGLKYSERRMMGKDMGNGAMRKSIAVSDLKAGQAFSQAVYIDEENVLVPANVSILQRDLDKLAGLGVYEVHTTGSALEKPAQAGDDAEPESLFAERRAGINPAHSFATMAKNRSAYRLYKTLIERMNYLFIRVSDGTPFDSRSVNAISTQLLQELRANREQYVGFVLGGEVKGYEMAKSAVNIAVLSGLTAQEIRLPYHRVHYIIVGALLHDAGMFRLPKAILEKQGELTEAERSQMRSHPLLSRDIVIKELSYPAEVGSIVLQHHERWDGTGYPQRSPGEGICVGARIVSIADSFEAMVSPKPYRRSILGYQANKNLLADNSRRFDPDILKVFILTMGVYPIGSIVMLSNGSVARVTEARASAPMRPKTQVLIDQTKRVFKSEEAPFVDLLTEKKVYIAKALDSGELSEMYARA